MTTTSAFRSKTRFAVACASTGQAPERPARFAYSTQDVARLMKLRALGDSLADVAKEVGGTRATARLVERLQLAHERAPQTMPRAIAESTDASAGQPWPSGALAVAQSR